MTWDSAARWYDWQLWLERAALRAAVDLATPGPATRVLDVGTGTGALLRELARRGSRPARVLGVDRSRAMLARVPPLPQGWVLERASATRLPAAAASFDIAYASFLLHVMSEHARAACLAELRRVIADDGKIVVVIPAWPVTRVGKAVYRRLLCLVGCNIAATLRPIEIADEAAAAGLGITARVSTHRGYPASCLLLRPIEAP